MEELQIYDIVNSVTSQALESGDCQGHSGAVLSKARRLSNLAQWLLAIEYELR